MLSCSKLSGLSEWQLGYMRKAAKEMLDYDGSKINEAPHAQQIIKIKMDFKVEKMDLIRKKIV